MFDRASTEEVGMSASRLNEINKVMQAFVDERKVAGISTLVARYGKVVHFESYGKLDLANDKPLRADSLFRIYSLTKLITSVAALMLYEEGHFRLDDPVSKWIPEFSNFKVMQDRTKIDSELEDLEEEITFWHLFTHTAGLGLDRPTSTQPIDEIYRDAKVLSSIATLQLPLQEIVEKVTQLPLCAQPGVTWHYSLAHDVLGYLIGQISGQPFDTFLRERIFEPLGMHDTSFYVPPEKLARFGPMYSPPDENELSVVDDVLTSPFLHADTVPSGGGGLISSMPDYFRFMLLLTNGGELDGVRLLRPDTFTAMTTNQLTGSAFPVRFNEPWPGMGYGLGIGILVEDVPETGWVGQMGWVGGSGTAAWIYPHQEMMVISMPQAWGYFEPTRILRILAHAAIEI